LLAYSFRLLPQQREEAAMEKDLVSQISTLSTSDASWAEASYEAEKKDKNPTETVKLEKKETKESQRTPSETSQNPNSQITPSEKAQNSNSQITPSEKAQNSNSQITPSEKAQNSNSQITPSEKSQNPNSQTTPSTDLPSESTSHKEQFKSLIESVLSVNVQVKLADQQADVNSPLYSVQSFEELGLCPDLLKGIYAMKFAKPSKVQEKALPLLLANPPQNMIAQSQSGTGKTAAFTLTMLSRVSPSPLPFPQALCLAPARELAKQIYDVATQMAKFTKITIAEAVPEANPRKTPLTAQVVIGTPGTVLELCKRGLLSLGQIKVLVFDEADVMLDKQTMGIQSLRVKKLCPSEAQILLFSATFSEAVEEFACKVAEPANRITLKREELSIDAIQQFWMQCSSHADKLRVLSSIYGLLTVGSSIIFVQTRSTAESVQRFMQNEGYTTEFLHGKLSPEERDSVIDGFRRGVTKVLITTNVLARGIDVSQVSLVINFDLPVDQVSLPDYDTYLHRIGRTGRFGRRGTAINLVHDNQSKQVLEAIRKHFGRPIQELPANDLEALDEMLKVNE
jgi:ATP-dependent RNA helicase DDX19/DBP5